MALCVKVARNIYLFIDWYECLIYAIITEIIAWWNKILCGEILLLEFTGSFSLNVFLVVYSTYYILFDVIITTSLSVVTTYLV